VARNVSWGWKKVDMCGQKLSCILIYGAISTHQ